MTETIIVNGTEEAINAINTKIKNHTSVEGKVSERNNLDGDTATWILISSFAVQSLPHILGFIKDIVNGKNVKKIKFGEYEVENPTPEMIEDFLKKNK